MKKFFTRLPFAFYFIPYIHLSLAIDYLFDSIVGIFLFLLLNISLGFYAKKTHQLPLLLLGNLLNIVISFLLVSFNSSLVSFYHASSPALIILLLDSLYMIAQMIGIFWGSFFSRQSQSKDRQNPNISL